MKTVLFVCFLALIAVTTYAASEEDDEKVRQCSCKEVEECFSKRKEEMKPCIDECKVSFFYIHSIQEIFIYPSFLGYA